MILKTSFSRAACLVALLFVAVNADAKPVSQAPVEFGTIQIDAGKIPDFSRLIKEKRVMKQIEKTRQNLNFRAGAPANYQIRFEQSGDSNRGQIQVTVVISNGEWKAQGQNAQVWNAFEVYQDPNPFKTPTGKEEIRVYPMPLLQEEKGREIQNRKRESARTKGEDFRDHRSLREQFEDDSKHQFAARDMRRERKNAFKEALQQAREEAEKNFVASSQSRKPVFSAPAK